MAANALRIVERELLDESSDAPGAALAELGYRAESEVAAAIRSGDLDGRDADVLACLNVLETHLIAPDTSLDAEGRNKHVLRLVELKHWAAPLGLAEERVT